MRKWLIKFLFLCVFLQINKIYAADYDSTKPAQTQTVSAAMQSIKDNFNAIDGSGTVPPTSLNVGTTVTFEGSTADTIETSLTLTDPTASDKTITLPNATGTVAVSVTTPVTLSALGDVGLTVAKDIVAGVGLSGGEDNVLTGADADTTLTLDLTEIATATFGSGTFTALTFDAGITDPTLTMGSNSIAITNAATITQAGDFQLTGTGPDYTLAVTGGDTFGWHAESQITYLKNNTDGIWYLLADTYHNLNLVPYVSNGRVGINKGVGTPAFNLDVTGTGNFTGNVTIGGSLTATNLSGTNTGDQTITLTGDVTGLGTGSFATTIAADSVALTTDTSGNYVKDIADGTGIDGTAAAEGATYTPTLDLTEINSATLGSGTFTTLIFDAGATDPTITMGSNSVAITNAATFSNAGDFQISGTGPDITWAVTAGDTFGLHAETQLSYFKNDTDGKFYWLADSLHNLQLVPYTTNGKVGINKGIADPAYNLDVTGTGRFTSNLTVDGTITTGGNAVYYATGTDVTLADGGTGVSLADPNANRIWGWDDTDNAVTQIVIGAGLTYTAATDTLTASGGDILDVFTVGVNGDYTTIQGALNAATPGDTILVSEGTYTEAITFADDNVALIATGSSENTTITQAAATVVTFGVSSGCTIRGFTVSLTAADGAADYCISSANDSVTDYNTIKDCIIKWTATTALSICNMVAITEGNIDIDHNRFIGTNTYAGTTASDLVGITTDMTTNTARITNNDFDLNNSATGTTSVSSYAIQQAGTTVTTYVINNTINYTTALAGASLVAGFYNANTLWVMNNKVTINGSSTGNTRGINSSGGTYYSISNTYDITNTDNDGKVFNAGTLGYSMGDSIIGNADYTAPTTFSFNQIVTADSTVAQTIKINAAQASVTAADTFIDFRSTTGSEGTIAGTASAGVIAYNTFTGSHYTQVTGDRTRLVPNILLEIVPIKITSFDFDKEITIKKDTPIFDMQGKEKKDAQGNVLKEPIDRKEIKRVVSQASTKGQLFKSQICKTRQSKNAIGVWGGQNNEGQDLCLSIGTGYLIIANKGINIQIGDLLISSDIEGCAELQADDLIHNYTVGKATESIIWNIGETQRTISVIYLGG